MARRVVAWLVVSGCFFEQAPADLDFAGANRPPEVEITAPADGAYVQVGGGLVLTAEVYDPDGARDVRSVHWTSNLDGDLGTADVVLSGGLAHATLSPGLLGVGVHTFTAIATDQGDAVGTADVQVELGLTPPRPTVQLDAPLPGTVTYVGATVLIEAQISHPNLPPHELTWQAEAVPSVGNHVVDLGEGPVSTSGAIRRSWFPPRTGRWFLSLQAEDPSGGTDRAEVSIEVVDPSTTDADGDTFSPADGDCDDGDDTVYPGAPELPDQRDNDCDGLEDEDTDLADDDGDGFCEHPVACTDPLVLPGDCDDDDPDAFPLAPERCNGFDDNCRDGIDEEDAFDCVDHYVDLDGDGYGVQPPDPRCLCAPDGDWRALEDGDCADAAAGIHPGAVELPNDDDDDCDGDVDEDTERVDVDGDGYCADPDSCAIPGQLPGDCDETSIAIHPGARERCHNTVDENCNQLLNEQGAIGCGWYFADEDRDGWGQPTGPQCWCDPTPPYDAVGPYNQDCDDADADAFPGQQNWFTRPTLGNGDFDFNCNHQEEKSEAMVLYQCSFDITELFCNTILAGFVGGFPDCGTTADWADDCSSGLFSCDPAGITPTTIYCR